MSLGHVSDALADRGCGERQEQSCRLWKTSKNTNRRIIALRNNLWKGRGRRREPVDAATSGKHGVIRRRFPQERSVMEPFRGGCPQGYPQCNQEHRALEFPMEGNYRRPWRGKQTVEASLHKGHTSRGGRVKPGDRQKIGAETQIRTGDTGLFRAVLYQLSYLGTTAGTTGFEPAISGVTIQRPRPD